MPDGVSGHSKREGSRHSTGDSDDSEQTDDDDGFDPAEHGVITLRPSHFRIRVRRRITADGGGSLVEQ